MKASTEIEKVWVKLTVPNMLHKISIFVVIVAGHALLGSCKEKVGGEIGEKEFLGDRKNTIGTLLEGVRVDRSIKSVMEKIKVTRLWNPKIDADLFIEEEYAFDTAERVYKGGDVLGVERISFGGYIKIGNRIDPSEFQVQWITVSYEDRYEIFKWQNEGWRLIKSEKNSNLDIPN